MIFWLQKAIDTLLLPPACLLILGLVGAIIGRRYPRSGTYIVATAVVGGCLLSTPFGAGILSSALEPAYVDPSLNLRGQAIVVLGGGISAVAPEFNAEAPSHATLQRVRYAAFLHRRIGKTLIVSGGRIEPEQTSEADVMRRVLTDEFGIRDVRTEERSRTTRENAQFSAELLLPQGIQSIYLVTDARHMPRAQWSFEKAGFEVIPSATGYTPARNTNVRDFLPSAGALLDSSMVIHEIIGLAWYRLQSAVGR